MTNKSEHFPYIGTFPGTLAEFVDSFRDKNTGKFYSTPEQIKMEEPPKDLSFGIKPPISLVPPTFIKQVARCMEDGAKKRSPYNWRTGKISAMQLLDKVLRHTLDTVDGQDLTEDSKLSNLASAAADIAVYLDALEHNVLIDDRPSRGVK